MLFATTGYVLLPSSLVWANPAGEQVVGGAATFQREGANLTVNQTTDRLAVNWQSFNIAAGEHTHFNMPSAASIALNRVLGGNPSDIRGTLTGNGTIIVANQFGISTAPGSIIKTGSLILTTKDINPEQFMHADPGQGIHLYGDSTATIVNQGNLTAEKGDVFLIAQKVENRGTISAPNGKAALVGAGGGQDKTDVVLYEKEGSGFAVRVTQLMGEAAAGSNRGLPDGEELLNEGEIAAAQAELNASGNIYALAIRNSGTIRAKAVVANADGTVRLDGGLGDVRNTGTLIAKNAGAEATAAGGKIEVNGQNVTASPESIITAAGGELGGNGGKVKIDSVGTTVVQGKVDVSAPAAGARGGKAEILGERVGLFEGAKVNASGGAGGGTVLVGGDYLGSQTPAEDLRGLVRLEDGPVKNAKATVMADTAEIRVDATANGDGGKIILWSDEYTGFYGELFARGGVEGGNGGFIETSSKNNLQAGGVGYAQSPRGERGLWLLDPLNVSITTSANFGGVYAAGTWLPNAVNSNVDVGVILASLAGGNDVVISTFGSQTGGNTGIIEEPGNIFVGAAIDNSANSNATGKLTLRADNSVTVDRAINIQGTVVITGIAGEIILNSSVTSIQGDVTMSAATGVESLFGANLRANAGSISLTTSTGDMSLSGSVQSDFGNVSLSANASSLFINGGVTSVGQSTFFGANGVTVSSSINTGTSNLNISSGNTGDININSPMSAGTLNISAGSDGADASIIFNGGANQVTAANDINLASRNNITFNSGSDVYLNNGVNRFDLFSENGSIDGGGTVRSGAGVFLINAENNVNLRLGSDTGTVTMDISATTGNISISSPNNITLAVIDSPFSLDAPSEAGSPSDPKGDITISATGILDMNGTRIIGGRVVTLSATGQIILNGGIEAGGVLGLSAPAIDIAPTGIGINIFSGGAVDSARGMVVNGALNSLDPDPANAGAFVIDLVLDGGDRAILELYGLVGAARPLASFASFGGLIRFFATGASDSAPSIAVVDDFTPNLRGYLNFDSTNLQLFQDTYLRSQGDMIFGGSVTSGLFVGQLFPDRFLRFDLASIVPAGTTEPNGGQIVFNGALGTDIAPLGKVVVKAQGTRPPDTTDPIDPTASRKDAQISVNAGITTFPGTNPLNTGADGGVDLQADGAIVVISGIHTAGGLLAESVGRNTIIGGNVFFRSDLDNDDQPNENIQLGGDSLASIRTRGGSIQFFGDVYLVQEASLNTTPGNVGGSITFNNRFDGVAGLTLDAGIAPIFFKGLVGSLTPSGLSVTSSGGITFDENVIMGGAYILNAEGEAGLPSSGITFNGTVDGRQAMVLNSRTGDIIFREAVGDTSEIASLTVGPGGLRPVGDIDKVYFYGDVTTAGNGVAGSSLISINKDVVIGKTGTFTFQTNARDNVTGGNISFLGSIVPDSTLVGEADLVFQAGSGGAIVFNGNVGNLDASYAPFGKNFETISISSAVGVGMGDGVVVYAEGRNANDPTIKIDAGLSSFFPQGRMTFRAGQGDIQILRGGDLSGVFTGPGNNTGGSKLLARVDGVGDITIGSLLNLSGGDNDTQATSNPGGPGFDSGYVFLYTESGVVDIGSISANGGASSGFGAGGSGLPFKAIPTSELASLGLAGTARITEIGAINLFGGNVIVNGALISNGGAGTTSVGGTGGGIQITLIGDAKQLAAGELYNETRAAFRAGSIYANGGASQSLVGGDGGSVKILAESGFLVAPTTFSLAGGAGANNAVLLAGRGGDVTISALGGLAPGQEGDVYFDNTQFNLTGNGDISILAGRNLALQYLKFNTTIDNLGRVQAFSEERLGGVVISMNQVAQGQALAQNLRGELNLGFSQSADGDYEYQTGKTAGLYMPSNAYILTNGGDVVITGGSEDNSTSGNAVISGISTSGPDVNGGNISIQNRASADLGNVVLGSSLETFGGTPVLPTYGRAGGSVTISGRDLNLRRIDTRGSASLATATAPAIGGAGGNVSLTASDGRTITLERDLLASGGQGLGVGDGSGGAGGNVSLLGNLTLKTGEPDRPDIMIDTSGGTGQGDGEAGQGGNIAWGRNPVDATAILQGTAANSNTLDLRYGSGTVTLGLDEGDVISLGELITAADDARSNGLLEVRAFMDSIATLTTYARGYSISLTGGGTVQTQTTFLNTGYVQVGNPFRDTVTTFAAGINTQTGPAATVLAGRLQTSDEFLDTEASILLGAVELGRNSSLDTFGNTLALGSVDSITAPFNLILLAGIGDGTIQLPGNFGAKAGQPSALGDGSTLVAPGTITLENPVDLNGNAITRPDSIVFGGTLTADGLISGNRNALEFRQDVNLSGTSDIAGNVVLNNLAGGSNILDFNMGAGSLLGGSVSLQGGAASMGGNGNWEVLGPVNGSQNLSIDGTGIKTFGGLIGAGTSGGLGGATGPSIRILADRVEFEQAVQTRFGINSEAGTATAFLAGANAATGGASDFLGSVELNTMTFTAGGATRFTDLNLAGGTVTLAGTGTYNTTGPVSGNGFNLILGGTTSSSKVFAGGLTDLGLLSLLTASGSSTFGGFVQADNILQAAGAGRANFAGNVEIRTGTLSSFAAGVLFGDGITFTASAGTATFLATSTPRLGGNVILAGAGDIAFDAALRGDTAIIGNTAVLTLSDSGQRIFGNTVSAGSLVQEAGAGLLSANQTITLADGLGTSRLRNAALTGMTLAAAGTVEILGTVTASGNTTISGGALPEAIVLGAGNNLVANTTGATFTLKGGVRMEADAVLDGVGNYAFANNINGASYLLTLGAGGTKAFQGQLSLDRIVQDDGSNTATFAGGVELVGDGILLGNVVLSGANQTFRSLGGSLQFGNAGSDLLTISKASVLVSDAFTSVTVASQIRLIAQLGIQTGSVFLGQIAGSSSNLSLDVNDVNLGGTVALGSGTMTMRSLDPLAISLGDNPLGLNLDKTELGLISTSGGLRIEDSSGSGISVDNVASADVAGITGPVQLLSTGGVVAFMTPSTLPKLGVAAQDVSGLNNATFQEIAQLELVNPAADININAGGSMAISGPVAIGNGKDFNLTTGGGIASTGLIQAGGEVNLTSRAGIASTGSIRAAGEVNLSANGDVVIGSRVSSGVGVLINPRGGYFVNQSGGQVFDNATLNSVNGVRVVTRDLFTPGLATAFVPGLQVVFGVSDPALLGRNQIGSTANFTDGNFAPYYFEFATGSAQPYIFAQQTAVPLVQFAPALNFAGGLPTPPRYTADELEMLTPEERSAYEARQREQSARVILQSSAGQEELGANPSAPQASRVPESRAPKTPTAQVWLQGKPMARSGSDSDRHDTTRLLRPKGTRAVALRESEMNTELLLAERISAEIGISAKPIASQR